MASPENQDDHPQPEEHPANDAGTFEAPPMAAPPPRKKGGLIGKLLSGVTLLALLAGAGGYAVVTFKDQDPRLKPVADQIEDGVGQARAFIDGLTGGQTAPGGKITTRRTALPGAEETAKAPVTTPAENATIDPVPQVDAKKAQREAEEAIKIAQAEAEAAARVEQEKAAAEQAEAEARAAEAKAAEAKAAEVKAAEVKAAEAKAAEDKAAEDKATQSLAAVHKTETDAGELSAQELIAALEGRIDELGEEINRLRGRLDSPKNETRAAPETEKPAAAEDSLAARVVVAYALQRQLDAGRPFAEELAAVERLGAKPESLQALKGFADTGAPTGEKLRADFAAVARRFPGEAAPAASNDLTDQLLQGASKFVKVRPSGQHAPGDSSVDARTSRVEAALTHNDFATAEAALAELPEAARSQAEAFGSALHARVEADRAAAALVHDAIAELGTKAAKK